MPRKKKVKKIRRPAVKMAKKRSRVLNVKNKRRIKQEQPVVMFDSNSGNVDNLFSAGIDAAQETAVTFADFKKREELENFLREFGFKFCGKKEEKVKRRWF